MFALLLSLLSGLGVAGFAAGAGGSEKSVTKRLDLLTSQKKDNTVIVPAVEEPAQEHAHDDTPVEEPAQEHAHDDTPVEEPAQEHAHDDTPVEEPAQEHAHDDTPVEEPAQEHAHDDTPVEEPAQEHAHDDTPVEEPAQEHAHDDTPVEEPAQEHAHDDMFFEAIAAPETAAEIAAFVALVQGSPDMHSHDHGSSKAGEHMAAMDLVPRDEATHIAIGHGDWDDPANWHNGQVPGDDARVLIPEGIHMTYDHVSEARLFTVRVDGKLEFSTNTNSQMVVDTIVISPSGFLEIGTETNPVAPSVNVNIAFANNGAIDTDWDPMLLSRGMIAHGSVEIHGATKDSHDKVVEDPMAGDTWVDMGGTPEGWAVGDTIVIAGTQYKGYTNRWNAEDGYTPPEDEIRIITEIADGMVFFDEPLIHNHDTPRDDLKTSVANYTRNVSFETENADDAEIFERGHVMFMHNDDVDVRYAEFHELGRTDKSDSARNVGEFESIDFDSNVKGRYAFHFHKAGMDDLDNPGVSVGNAVFGSPGWGFVHHDSNALFENNATYDTFGAGYVAESGNETGAWIDNIAIFAQGNNWRDPKFGNDVDNFDLGLTGDGFWFQSRMVASIDNIAASVNNGFVYFNRGPIGEEGQINFDADTSVLPSLFSYAEALHPNQHPILGFSGNEAFASQMGLYVLKASPHQGHDVHTVLQDFTAWEVQYGADLSYTAHYTLKDFDLIGSRPAASDDTGLQGIILGPDSWNMTIVDPTVENFRTGISLHKKFGAPTDPELADYTVINATFIDVGTEFIGLNPELDDILTWDELPMLKPDIALDGPLSFKMPEQSGEFNWVNISGIKTDSLGETDFPTEIESYKLHRSELTDIMREDGYYTTSGGQNYLLADLFFSDRLTGDIYMERHPVLLDDNVPLNGFHWDFKDISFSGVQDLGGENDPTIDSAVLWATLTEGQPVLTEEALALMEDKDELVTGEPFDM